MNKLDEESRLVMSIICHLGWNPKIKVEDGPRWLATRFYGTAEPKPGEVGRVRLMLETLAFAGCVMADARRLCLTRKGEEVWIRKYGHRV